ncbi:spore germination protein [Bacillus sp. MRMR6]|uniref:spore germination protein n=1 Tax=Bacillus sp. MRMR6 TaxID=1928617 RepID=UPI00095314F7|nr:spore germination protein [Bacillus sp. MRMR6]OLS38548.1 hypothetical protein BTR25_14085 [Bacillus sp. MRMR6]
MSIQHEGVTIGTISGGIVNFGGAIYISPISVTKTNSGSGENNTDLVPSEGSEQRDQANIPELLNLIRAMLK